MKVTEILQEMERYRQQTVARSNISASIGSTLLSSTTIARTESALMFDSVYTFAAGLSNLELQNETRYRLINTKLSCELDEQPWPFGSYFYSSLYNARLNGLTGPIEFSASGQRVNFKLDLLKLKRERIRKVGEWSSATGINVTDATAFYETHATNITLIVMTRAEKPYVMVRNDRNLTGNARFEGFCIDLLKGIARQIGFQFDIRLVPDHMYGVYDPETKSWNGIVRELMERVSWCL